ncbi:cysteine synthase family protein [Pseudomonas alliivorans]|nr:cysteine synthase family protein [Pseudomonas alliivorans]
MEFKYANSLSELIGNTPLIKVSETNKNCIFGKLEYLNPTGSLKDRTAYGLLSKAMASGDLREGMGVVESTSGNLGHALASLCAALQIKFVCVMDPKTSVQNVELVKAYGGEVVLVTEKDADGGYQKNRIKKAREIAANDDGLINLDQYDNPDALNYHAETTGKEILQQTNGRVDLVVGAVSTGSSLCGIAKYLKSVNPNIKVAAIEPYGSTIFGGISTPFLMNGIGLSFTPKNYEASLIDYEMKVSDADAFATIRKHAKSTGMLLGGSSGAVLYAAKQLADELDEGMCIIALLPDGGLKYLSTVYNDDWLNLNGITL